MTNIHSDPGVSESTTDAVDTILRAIDGMEQQDAYSAVINILAFVLASGSDTLAEATERVGKVPRALVDCIEANWPNIEAERKRG